MTTRPEQDKVRDDVLVAVHEVLLTGDLAELRQLADEHPEHKAEILAFVAAWLVADDDASDDDDEGPTQSREEVLERFWFNYAAPANDPFCSLDAHKLREVASRCRIDTGILRKLTLRMIDEGSIPGKLVSWLAEAVGSEPQQLYGYLCGTQAEVRADFFAPSGPRKTGKVEFAEAVRTSTLSPELKRYWLPNI